MDDLVERNDLYFEKFTNTPFTGEVSGKDSGKFKNGKRNGLWEYYDKDGQLILILTWKNGNKDGLWEFYDKNGLIRKGNYKDGKHHGLRLSYHVNGQLWAKGNYKDGKQHGE